MPAALSLWKLVSRKGQSLAQNFPEVARALAVQPVRQAVFDGEVVALDAQSRPSFQRLQNRGNDSGLQTLFYAFDLLYLDGWNLERAPLEARKELLRATLAPVGPLHYLDHFDDGLALFDAGRAIGLEGILAKQRGRVYAAGQRTRSWLRAKASKADEFVGGGYTEGTGRRKGTFGSLLLGRFRPDGTLRYVGNVGSGFDERTLEQVRRRLGPLVVRRSPFPGPLPKRRWQRAPTGRVTWVKPEVVAEVRYGERTDDGMLRHAVFLRLRDDKPAVEVRKQPVVRPPSAPAPSREAHEEDVAWALARLEGGEKELTLSIDGHEIGLMNLDKPLWPA